jgi:DNA-binding XRE family transcriptional regulator
MVVPCLFHHFIAPSLVVRTLFVKYLNMIKSPSPQKLKEVRAAMGFTQSEAAEMVHVSLRAWQLWEAGDRKIPPGLWELCIIKAGLHPLYRKA